MAFYGAYRIHPPIRRGALQRPSEEIEARGFDAL
jgi:hypothetical protein